MPLHIVNAIQRQKPFKFNSATGAPDVEGCGIRDVHVPSMYGMLGDMTGMRLEFVSSGNTQ